MKRTLIYCLLITIISLQIDAENASNVRVRQQNKDIIVTYDLSKTSNVYLSVATDDHPSFTPLNAVEGAIGKNVRAGKNLEIIWHPLEEGDNFIAKGVMFKVEALSAYEEYVLRGVKGGKSDMETFITADFAYTSKPQMSYGLTLGQTYRGYGWYISSRSNFHFESATNGLTCTNGGYIKETLPFYSGRTQSSIFVINIGFVMDILEAARISDYNRFNTFGFYMGGGYGWRRLLWETTDCQWIEYGASSYSGFNADWGIIGSVYGLTLKAGISTIGFKYVEFETGIGWMF